MQIPIAPSNYIFILIRYFFTFISEAHITYGRNTLINVRKGSSDIVLSTADLETITAYSIFRSPSQTNWTKPHCKRCDCPRARGKKARIRAKPTQAIPLLSLLLANVQSQENKMDEIRLRLTQQQEIRECSHMFTETWLHHNIPDQTIALDVTQDFSTMSGGALYVYINDAWCSKVVKVEGQCFPDVEFLI